MHMVKIRVILLLLAGFYDWIYEGVYEWAEKIVAQLVGWWAVDRVVIRIEQNINKWLNNNSDASHACKNSSSPQRLFLVRHCV